MPLCSGIYEIMYFASIDNIQYKVTNNHEYSLLLNKLSLLHFFKLECFILCKISILLTSSE